MRRTGVVWGSLLATIVAGCAVHWDVESYAAPEGNVAARQSYFWKGGDFAASQQLDAKVVRDAETYARAAVTEELQRKGYTEVASADAADLVVSYQVAGMRRFVTDETPRIGAPSPNTVLSPAETQPPPASSMPREVAVRDGSVILFVDDVKLGKLAWRGEVAEELRTDSAEQTARVIGQMLRQIAKAVPARAGAAP